MRSQLLLFSAIMAFVCSCGQTRTGNIGNLNNNGLTCLILGYDSIIYYTGNMQQVKKGKLTDTMFVNEMFQKIKVKDLELILKPGDGGDVVSNFREMVNLLNIHDVTKRSIDSINANEEKAFGFSTPPQIKATMRNQTIQPLKLDLPKDESGSPSSISGLPKESQLTILFSDRKNLYAYLGTNISNGKKYSFEELNDTLKARRSGKEFSVAIKPTNGSTYSTMVDILDLMNTLKVEHYALIDITVEEEGYFNQLIW
jgi:biopolymer transport protein ExbD